MELDKSQLISISPTVSFLKAVNIMMNFWKTLDCQISYLKSYHSAIRAEAVFRINTNPMDNSDVKIEVDFFLIDDRNNKVSNKICRIMDVFYIYSMLYRLSISRKDYSFSR
jgi:hypothetical protein